VSSFEVFALNRNEHDFLQNLKIISDIETSKNFIESPLNRNSPNDKQFKGFFDEYDEDKKILEQALEEVKGMFNDHEHVVIVNLFNVNYKVLLAAAWSFIETKDKDDFVHTVKLIIK